MNLGKKQKLIEFWGKPEKFWFFEKSKLHSVFSLKPKPLKTYPIKNFSKNLLKDLTNGKR